MALALVRNFCLNRRADGTDGSHGRGQWLTACGAVDAAGPQWRRSGLHAATAAAAACGVGAGAARHGGAADRAGHVRFGAAGMHFEHHQCRCSSNWIQRPKGCDFGQHMLPRNPIDALDGNSSRTCFIAAPQFSTHAAAPHPLTLPGFDGTASRYRRPRSTCCIPVFPALRTSRPTCPDVEQAALVTLSMHVVHQARKAAHVLPTVLCMRNGHDPCTRLCDSVLLVRLQRAAPLHAAAVRTERLGRLRLQARRGAVLAAGGHQAGRRLAAGRPLAAVERQAEPPQGAANNKKVLFPNTCPPAEPGLVAPA